MLTAKITTTRQWYPLKCCNNRVLSWSLLWLRVCASQHYANPSVIIPHPPALTSLSTDLLKPADREQPDIELFPQRPTEAKRRKDIDGHVTFHSLFIPGTQKTAKSLFARAVNLTLSFHKHIDPYWSRTCRHHPWNMYLNLLSKCGRALCV